MPAKVSRALPTQALTVFLIKTGSKRYEDALKESTKLTRHRLKRNLPLRGVLFLAPQRRSPPRWMGFLQEVAATDLGSLFNASASAVLFLKASQRTFAFAFGYGRALLRPERVERSFGLRVVLNTVDPAGLRSVDSKTVQELTVHTRRQTSRGSRLTDFAIDTEQDLVSAVTGTPRDSTFARMVSGSDALLFRSSVAFSDLSSKCNELLRAYRSQEYKERGFAFVDHVRKVTDPALIDELDQKLIEALRTRSLDSVHLAPPVILDWESIDGFSFANGADPDRDLLVKSFFAQIRKPEEISTERLRRQQVFVHARGAAEPQPTWPVYNTLVAEFDQGSRRFVLSGGDWYEIERGFVARVAGRIRRLKAANLGLAAARAGEHEKAYNQRAASRPGVYLTDRKCLREAGDPIELCDLYTSKRQFVHVKRWKASATLSHLFAQGVVSAETFVSDGIFREQARGLLGSQAASLRAHFPHGRPDATSYEVVYAIIMGRGRRWQQSLPFFSQLHLARAAEGLRRLGFTVRLERIGVEDRTEGGAG